MILGHGNTFYSCKNNKQIIYIYKKKYNYTFYLFKYDTIIKIIDVYEYVTINM